MTIPPGARLGAYEVLAKLGAGGMGEVYRARDSKLKRDVAIKVLPADVASDRDRLARFQREAEVLASLNHPNIAHVHGLEESGGVTALVMELVDGEDLSERIGRGPIPLDEALPIARQIADALEAAHEQGIIHRDLKPANIKVRDDGTVKVLDFGLAKAMDQPSGLGPQASALANSPTITSPALTMHGVILGTAAYMAPEQAKGSVVDKRADIWAFGAVLYEMLTGRRAFDGEDSAEVISSVIKTDPDWHALPASVPPHVRTIVMRCLAKHRKNRIPDMSVVRFALDGWLDRPAMPAAADHAAPAWRRAGLYVACALAGAAAFALVIGAARPPTSEAPVSRLSIDGVAGFDDIAISPDGTRILIRAGNTLALRSMANFEIVPLKIAATGVANPLFSPDGQSISFTAGRVLKRTTIAGGAAVDLATLPTDATGCQWSGDHIYCAVGAKGIVRVPAGGGSVEQLITMQAGEVAGTPAVVPGGETIIFSVAPGVGDRGDWLRSSIVAETLATQRRNVLAASGSDPRYVPNHQVAYLSEGVWFVVGYDTKTARAVGAPVAVIEGVGRFTQGGLLQPRGKIDLSANGTVVYARGPLTFARSRQQVILADRNGQERVLPLDPMEYESPRISPDGRQLAISTHTATEAAVWVYDLAGGHAPRRLTFTGRNRLPVWSPDSRRLAFQSDRGGDTAIFVQPADGSADAERWTTAANGVTHVPEAWSLDGRWLAFSSLTDAGADLWLRSIATGEVARFSDVHSNAPLNAAFSPDGRWIAYSVRGAATSVFIQPVPATGARYQITTESTAHHPFWSPDGRQLFFWGMGGGIMLAAPVPAAGPSALGPAAVVPGNYATNMNALGPRNYDITPDGRAFVRTRGADAVSSDQGLINVVLNWTAEKASQPGR